MTTASQLDLLAGRAVAEGALHAGPLAKRSEWFYAWKTRFVVLSTEALTLTRLSAHTLKHLVLSNPALGRRSRGSSPGPASGALCRCARRRR